MRGGVYRRTLDAGNEAVVLTVHADPSRPSLVATLPVTAARAVVPTVARLRALFDLDAEPARIAADLGRHRTLRPLVAQHPGLRVPGAFDAFELAVRAVLGQQISVRGATTLAGRLVARFGDPLPAPDGTLTHRFPSPAVLAAAGERRVAAIGLPAARAATLVGLAEAFASGALRLDPSVSHAEAMVALTALRGIGPWTAEYMCMRVLGWPDAFPASDLGLRRALGGVNVAQATRLAEPWRPWRAYAAMHLWHGLAAKSPRARSLTTPLPEGESA